MVWLSQLLSCSILQRATALPCPPSVRVSACVCEHMQVSNHVCSFHPALAPISASNMSSMLHDSVQALAGDGLGHGVPLGQTGL